MSKIRKKLAVLRNIYKRIPNANCKGLCVESCSMIGFTKLEGNQMAGFSGKQPFITDNVVCGYLSEGKCSIYEVRPAICRLFGVTEKLPCEFGCTPDKILLEVQSMQILSEIDKLGDGIMHSNVSKLQAVNMKLDRPLNAPLKEMQVQNVSSIVPYIRKD